MLRSPGNARRVRRNPLPASTSAGPLAACPAHAQHGPGGNPAACFPERREWPEELRGQASCDRSTAGIGPWGKIESQWNSLFGSLLARRDPIIVAAENK